MSSVVVVGAGPGLGMALARRFGREGMTVGLVALHQARLDELVDELAADNITALAAAADVADRASLHAALDRFDRPDVLLYNAAVGSAPGAPSEVSADVLLKVLAVGVGGLVHAVQHVLPGMRKQGSGTIIVTGSGIAIDPWVEAAALSVGKSAQRAFAHALHREVIEDGIQAATVTIRGVLAPGGRFDPQVVAEEFWAVHTRPRAEWTWEHLYG
jgi:NADP-dependent 3-hydroxy acid dehydrogenase YdfG